MCWSQEVRLYSIEEGKFVRRFAGHQQSTQFIRNCIGGVQENFIITGSEGQSFGQRRTHITTDSKADSCVYVWNRFTGELVHTLKGHEHGTVNAVAWSNTGIPRIASVGDDRTVRIWEPDAGDADRKAPAS